MIRLRVADFDSLADPEHVAVGMTDVHLADVPRHVGRRPRHLESAIDASPVNLIYVHDPVRQTAPLSCVDFGLNPM